ncbi:MAG TPA: DUF3943 domain-containing protein [Burkholderiaceae bacterium]|nr:DUF3943 domain-containing protein [Burkholderiaceae bacterium]
MALSILRRRVVVAATAALCFSLSLASPAIAEEVEPEGEGIQAGRSAPQQLDVTIDWKGLRRDTLYFVGYQFVVVGVLYAMPESVTNFDKNTAGVSKWWDNVSNPARDEDDAYLNWITHPYWGATYYIRGRERGLSRWQSFGYSALLSTLFEYGAEAFFEKPSYQDLWITPVIGSLLGEFVFSPLRESIKAKPGGPDGMDKFLLVLTDPLGAANELTNRLFGVETQVSFVPMGTTRLSVSPTGQLTTTFPGSRVASPHPDSGRLRGVTWGLKLEARW